MEISCEPIKFSCIKPPTAADISKLKDADLVPDTLITKIFKGLETDYKSLKGKTPTKSKTKGGRKSRKAMLGGKGKRKSLKAIKKKMRGGALSDFQKNRIVDMVILLVAGGVVAGGSYWSVATALESFIVSIGILPKLCGQSAFEHLINNVASTFGSESCVARTQRYNNIVVALTTTITASAWYRGIRIFDKAYIAKNYSKVHKNFKKLLFASDGPLTPSPSPSPERSRTHRSRSRSRSPPQQQSTVKKTGAKTTGQYEGEDPGRSSSGTRR